MSRLIILLGPVASACAGAALGFAFDQLVLYSLYATLRIAIIGDGPAEATAAAAGTDSSTSKEQAVGKGKKGEKAAAKEVANEAAGSKLSSVASTLEAIKNKWYERCVVSPVCLLLYFFECLLMCLVNSLFCLNSISLFFPVT